MTEKNKKPKTCIWCHNRPIVFFEKRVNAYATKGDYSYNYNQIVGLCADHINYESNFILTGFRKLEASPK